MVAVRSRRHRLAVRHHVKARRGTGLEIDPTDFDRSDVKCKQNFLHSDINPDRFCAVCRPVHASKPTDLRIKFSAGYEVPSLSYILSPRPMLVLVGILSAVIGIEQRDLTLDLSHGDLLRGRGWIVHHVHNDCYLIGVARATAAILWRA